MRRTSKKVDWEHLPDEKLLQMKIRDFKLSIHTSKK